MRRALWRAEPLTLTIFNPSCKSIEGLEAPDCKQNHSSDLLHQQAVEKECNREASQNVKPGTIQQMQFSFGINTPMPTSNVPVTKQDMKPPPEPKGNSTKRGRALTCLSGKVDNTGDEADPNDQDFL